MGVKLDDRTPIPGAASVVGFVKHDDNKPRYSLIPSLAIASVVDVLEYGAVKYAPGNWRKGCGWLRYGNACMRHLWAWLRGENIDPESGHHHLAHAICSLLFALDLQLAGRGTDDRKGHTYYDPD